ncbi:MAG: leucyl/phenylalanyl-tRNA--protein transferase [Pseudomonadota bacterium]
MADSADADEIYWVDPRHRGIIPLDGFHVSRSLAKRLRRADYTIAVNRDFAGTVTACADRDETWINARIFDLYAQLHQMGCAHSLEVYSNANQLIGGVYGVELGGAFFGESMFSAARDGSKIALSHLVDRLKARGFQLFDTQFLTDHLASLGGIEIPRSEYRKRLASALTLTANFG